MGWMEVLMEGKVLLYDSNDIKIGETFTRRARQLVKQQRASWINENQDAIRFAPGMENFDATSIDDVGKKRPMRSLDTEDELMKLAKRRVYARFAFELHGSIALALSVLFVVIYMLTNMGGYFWPIWPAFGLGVTVAIHWVVYKVVSGDGMNDKISIEYEKLKYRHSYVDNVDP